MKTVLVTGVGAIIGYGIINALKAQRQYDVRIVGMDIYEDAYGRFLCDKFYKAVLAYSDEYACFVNNIVEKEKVDIIIPGIEQDMYKLSQIQDEVPAKIVLNNQLLIDISKDKLKTYTFFKDKNLNIIPTLYQKNFNTCSKELGVPFLLKPRSSYASKGIHIIHNIEEFNFYNQVEEANIFQKIVGSDEEEYTVSVFGLSDGSFSDYIILRRKLAQTGATDKAIVVERDDRILEYVASICQVTKPIGPTNIQLRKEGESIFLLEINPRISSACSIRCAAGYNEPLLCLNYYLDGQILEVTKKKTIKAVRFIGDFIYE